MEIEVVAGTVLQVDAAALVMGYFEGQNGLSGDLAAVDAALGGAIADLIRQGEIKGKAKEITLIHTLGKLNAPRVAVVGLGKAADFTMNKLRAGVGEACRWLRPRGVDTIAVAAQGLVSASISAEKAAQAITEGALLGLYTFRAHITKKDDSAGEVKRLSIVSGRDTLPRMQAGSARGRILAEAANRARDIINEPANFITPADLADAAVKLAARHGLAVEVFEPEQIEALGMGSLLGVARGSRQPPRFITLRYQGRDSADLDVALVGKAITFDSGGLSLKTWEGMVQMKGDKAGGVAVMQAIAAVAQLKPKINVAAFIPATENMPGDNALKPGDILTAITGETIEVISTDAEGRLILADALGYACQQKARRIIDVATLTGACRVALGTLCSGALGNDQALIDRVVAAGNETGELMWALPMFDEYREQLKSDVADIKNVGGNFAGAITAAKFLADFVGKTPWVHLDIAGTSQSDKERGYLVKGSTGVPVRTLVTLVLSLAE